MTVADHTQLDEVHLGDCVQLLNDLPDGSAQLVIADPPYNLGPRFGLEKEWVRDEKWLPWCANWLGQCQRVLSDDGNLLVYGIHHYLCYLQVQLYEMGMHYRRQIIWHYTRFPVGVLKSPELAWGTSQRVHDLYERPSEALRLTALGRAAAEQLRIAADIREFALESYSIDTRAAFANYGYYCMLLRSGLDYSEVADDLTFARAGCNAVLSDFGISDDPSDLLYSPIQQADDAILAEAQDQ